MPALPCVSLTNVPVQACPRALETLRDHGILNARLLRGFDPAARCHYSYCKQNGLRDSDARSIVEYLLHLSKGELATWLHRLVMNCSPTHFQKIQVQLQQAADDLARQMVTKIAGNIAIASDNSDGVCHW